jgi:hypothetical protein
MDSDSIMSRKGGTELYIVELEKLVTAFNRSWI